MEDIAFICRIVVGETVPCEHFIPGIPVGLEILVREIDHGSAETAYHLASGTDPVLCSAIITSDIEQFAFHSITVNSIKKF